jgi:alkanesulfonate monooxygenase SsuD/methylene tetrahydromethanopterin reductase-like flavin-dependent oxidoreductase (luciferase family)
VFLLAARIPGQSDDEVLTAAVQATVAAERAGFDDVWLAERHFMAYGICPSAVTRAGYVPGQTERVDVGTAVSVLPVRLERTPMTTASGTWRQAGPWRRSRWPRSCR